MFLIFFFQIPMQKQHHTARIMMKAKNALTKMTVIRSCVRTILWQLLTLEKWRKRLRLMKCKYATMNKKMVKPNQGCRLGRYFISLGSLKKRRMKPVLSTALWLTPLCWAWDLGAVGAWERRKYTPRAVFTESLLTVVLLDRVPYIDKILAGTVIFTCF